MIKTTALPARPYKSVPRVSAVPNALASLCPEPARSLPAVMGGGRLSGFSAAESASATDHSPIPTPTTPIIPRYNPNANAHRAKNLRQILPPESADFPEFYPPCNFCSACLLSAAPCLRDSVVQCSRTYSCAPQNQTDDAPIIRPFFSTCKAATHYQSTACNFHPPGIIAHLPPINVPRTSRQKVDDSKFEFRTPNSNQPRRDGRLPVVETTSAKRPELSRAT
jgi:hypothetical protein